MWRVGKPARRAAGLLAVVSLAVSAGAAYTSAPSSGAARLAGTDRYGTAVAVSQAAFPRGASLVYVATGLDFADALAAAAASGGNAPVLLVTSSLVPSSTAAELRRLQPTRVVVLGGTTSVSDQTLAAIRSLVPGATTTRIAGLRRYDTAAALSSATFAAHVPVAFVATGLDYPDALTAAAAADGHGPVLLTYPTSLPPATAQELQRLAPGVVHVVGGTNAVQSSVLSAIQQLVPNATVDRVAGPDRFSTATAISRLAFARGASMAYAATGFDFPDALSAAVVAAGSGPVLLVDGAPFTSPAVAELSRLGAQALTVVGGVAAVATSVVNQLVGALAPPPPVSPNASAVVATARAQLGKPYEWGGAGPDSYDCSGLVMVAWAAAGVHLPHNAEMQADAVAPVAIANLQPGDIVFYGTPGNVYHDGIYIGNGQMIEAAHTGVPVRIADIQRPDLLIGGRPHT